MSSPLSSLSKGRKPGFSRPAPFRPVVDIGSIINADLERANSSSSMTDDIPPDCVDLVNDHTNSVLQKRKTSNSPRNPWKSNNTVAQKQTPDDMELMSSMMGRISQLQIQVQFQEKEISDKDNQIKMLQQRLKAVENTSRLSTTSHHRSEALERENKKLRKQVYDMEEFLSDYGMMWAGDSDSDLSDDAENFELSKHASKVWQPNKSVPGFSVNYDQIIENIRDLNILAGEGETRIHHTNGGAELKRPDPVQLSLYANGILMFNGPFRPFTDPETQVCIQDLMDGYFPTELQTRYPDGVLFSVHDHRHSHYESKKNQKAFDGHGQVLGGETKPSRLVPSNLDKSTHTNDQSTTNLSHVNPVTADKFLSKLPTNVIKKGKVINIRQAVSDMIQGEDKLPEGISLVNTALVEDLRKSAKGGRAPSEDLCSTLRIKHGEVTYVLVMKYTQTLGEVRQNLCQHEPKLKGLKYDLVTSYPRKVYDDVSVTLEDAGLVPNAMLHLQMKK